MKRKVVLERRGRSGGAAPDLPVAEPVWSTGCGTTGAVQSISEEQNAGGAALT